MTESTGRQFGAAWEQAIQHRARSNGLLVIKNSLTAQYIPGGHTKITKSELDFKVFNRQGKVVYLDAKSFAHPYFDYSDLLSKKPPLTHQIDRACLYQDWNVLAGFLVWFRPVDVVAFFPGFQIARNGPGTRFFPESGVTLGSLYTFNLQPLFGFNSREIKTAER